jgi:hypothetical protein
VITSHRLEALMYDLPLLLAASRGRRGLSITATAAEVGCAVSTISRMEAGFSCDVRTLILLLRWIEGE